MLLASLNYSQSLMRAQTTAPGWGKSVPSGRGGIAAHRPRGTDAESNVLIFSHADAYLSWCPHFAHFADGAHFVTFCPNLNVESDSRR